MQLVYLRLYQDAEIYTPFATKGIPEGKRNDILTLINNINNEAHIKYVNFIKNIVRVEPRNKIEIRTNLK
jgi:hypothetical protein